MIVVYVLDHGLSIRVKAQRLLTERNNGKRIVATGESKLRQEGASKSTQPYPCYVMTEELTKHEKWTNLAVHPNQPGGINALEPPPSSKVLPCGFPIERQVATISSSFLCLV